MQLTRKLPRAAPLAAFAAFLMAGCAPLLSAEAPLFSPTDEHGPAPFAEGVWMQESSTCAETQMQSRYADGGCTTFELSRLSDGAWRLEFVHPAIPANQNPRTVSLRVVLAPATERANTGLLAALYLAEYVEMSETGPSRPSYVAVTPVGRWPARALYLIPVLCDDALADPPIAGVTGVRDDEGRIVSCAAASQAAVREAVRRAAIEHLDTIDLIRFTWRRRSNRSSPDLLVDCSLPQSATLRAQCGEDQSP